MLVDGGAFRIITVWAEATPAQRVVISAAATASSRGGFDIKVDLTSRMQTDIGNEQPRELSVMPVHVVIAIGRD
jgi:hypothetical protein